MEKITLTVKGMTCGHCVSSVKNALQSIKGINSAEVDLKAGVAIVEGTNTNVATLIGAVKEEGCEAEVKEA